MERTYLKGKIHKAVVTEADLHYEGSITVDALWLRKANINEFEKVQVVDINNGARFETYVIQAPVGSKTIKVNGAAARLVAVGDEIIIFSFANYGLGEYNGPAIVLINEENK